MQYRTLGRTGLNVSIIGLGTEYLRSAPDTVSATVQHALNNGVNYIDFVFSFPEYLDNLGAALKGSRESIFLVGHLGSTEKNGQYHKTRSVKKSETFFLDLLKRLHTDYVDILMLHNCDSQKDYDTMMNGGILELAQRLQQEGKTRFLGFSGHTVATATQAVKSGYVDMLMFPINLTAHAVPGKKDLLQTCVEHNVGIVAMKPFAGGKLVSKDRTVKVGKFQRGGEALKVKKPTFLTPVHCLAYALSQIGVTTTIPGCANPDQMAETLAYLDAAEIDTDFADILADFQQYEHGECVYCNHCLPCPSAIDIGQVTRLFDAAYQQMTAEVTAAYRKLSATAADCVECGVCEERCPFGVKVIENMRQAATLFG